MIINSLTTTEMRERHFPEFHKVNDVEADGVYEKAKCFCGCATCQVYVRSYNEAKRIHDMFELDGFTTTICRWCNYVVTDDNGDSFSQHLLDEHAKELQEEFGEEFE